MLKVWQLLSINGEYLKAKLYFIHLNKLCYKYRRVISLDLDKTLM